MPSLTVGAVKNADELAKKAFGRRNIHFSEMSGNEINPTELVAAIINQERSFAEGIQCAQDEVEGSCSLLLLTEKGIYVARVYYQRPCLREMFQLYANVTATTFIAGEISDLDVREQVEPVVTSVLGCTLTSAIPGVSVLATIITESLLTGSANSYLTLRVGVITKQYCGAILRKERRLIRRTASLEAARMVSQIVMSSAGSITKAVVNAAMKSPGRLSRSVIQSTWKKISKREKDKADRLVES